MARPRRRIRPLLVLGAIVGAVWAWREAALRRDESRIAAITPTPSASPPPRNGVNGASSNGG